MRMWRRVRFLGRKLFRSLHLHALPVYGLYCTPIALAWAGRPNPNPKPNPNANPNANPNPNPNPNPNAPLGRNFVADAAALAAPSVVHIYSQARGHYSSELSAGAGFIVSEDGFIVTNAHVVAGATELLVILHNGKRLNGRVHGRDLNCDLAVVKVNTTEKLPVAKIGASSQLRPGEFVLALGSPLQLTNTVTFGIVSAVARHSSDLGMRSRTDFIQTDASVNAGNSGGPLVNLDGEVIGINTMKAVGTDGISFALPIDTAWQVVTQLIEKGRVVRPYIGMKMANVIDRHTYAGPLSAQENTQVLIVDVEPLSPAEKAGAQKLDVILEVNGKEVKSTRDVLDGIGQGSLEVGKRLRIKVKRNGSAAPIDLNIITEPER